MRRVFRLVVLLAIKVLSRLCFRVEVTSCGPGSRWPTGEQIRELRLILLLNHTSLFEPIYLAAVPLTVLWRLATSGTMPGADVTLNRPLTGRFFKILVPSVVAITRRRDETWDAFLEAAGADSLVLMAPEGRMKRPGGLDKEGKPMTVRGGVADLLWRLERGQMLVAYSGGLHHVHAPGQRFPRLFRRVSIAFETLDIAEYKRQLAAPDAAAFKRAVIADLEGRRDRFCPGLATPAARLSAR